MYVSQVPLDEANVPKCGQEFLEKHKINSEQQPGCHPVCKKAPGMEHVFHYCQESGYVDRRLMW